MEEGFSSYKILLHPSFLLFTLVLCTRFNDLLMLIKISNSIFLFKQGKLRLFNVFTFIKKKHDIEKMGNI